MSKRISLLSFSAAAMLSIAASVFAESAPVFDADTMQEQFDNAGISDTSQDVPPPAPGQEGQAFVTPQPSAAPSPPPTPAVAKTNSEKRPKAVDQGQVPPTLAGEAAAKADSLQEQVQSLRGQLEQVTHQLEQMQAQQKALLMDVDKRINEVNTKPTKKLAAGLSVDSGNQDATTNATSTPVTTTANADTITKTGNNKATTKAAKTTLASAKAADINVDDQPKGDQPNVAEEQQIYQTAYNLIKAKKYDEAVTALQNMLKKYPSGQFASNAHYWLGELFGLMNKNDNALTEFTIVVSKYPDSPRVSDAQLKVGLIYAAESNWSEAKTAFKKVINHYPQTASARVASEQLKAIKQAGN